MMGMQAPARGTGGDAGRRFDELLVTLVQGGDRAAGERLVRRWHPRLLRTARRLVGAEMAPGVVQEAWISILRGIGSLRDPARFAPWAFGILHRRCADAIRRAQARRSIAMGEVEAPVQPAPDEALALVGAFAALPAEQRLAAQLFFVEGLTLAEIAEVQQVPVGTAKSRLFHARRRLKAALEGE
uniref:RNA polymerase sigma factor n=1 Tax=Altererythrobacter segetis TaxID=1104773 RepID=UPI00140D5453|nr:RNA polymerase sigma factor [Altererythrobacter segetis]